MKYSYDGAFVFGCWKNNVVSLHDASNANPIGTYEDGHEGAVVSCDVTSDNRKMFSSGRDSFGILWDTETGEIVYKHLEQNTLLHSSNFSHDDNLIMFSIMKKMRAKNVYNEILDLRTREPVAKIVIPNCVQSDAMWADENTIVSGLDNGCVVIHDFKSCIGRSVENVEESHTKNVQMHQALITKLDSNPTRTMFVTSSNDKHVKVFDLDNIDYPEMDVNFGELANSASIHPNNKYLVVTGGQPPLNVTKTSHESANFYAKFYYMPTQQLYGQAKSHFGTPLACAFNPRGDSFASGGHDGFLKVHQLDQTFNSYEVGLSQAMKLEAGVV